MSTAILKADQIAADRILKAACNHARDLIRNGQDARPVLAVAGAAAELLIGAPATCGVAFGDGYSCDLPAGHA